MTYSIIGRDPAAGEIGIAVQSRWVNTGQDVAWIEPDVGAVCTQAMAEPAYGQRDRRRLLRTGEHARERALLETMVDAFENTGGALADRLLAALDAAEREGGDARGWQAARLFVSRAESTGIPWQDRVFDLQVVDHPEPVSELRRLVNVKRAYDRLGRAFELARSDAGAAAGEADAAHELAPADDQIAFWRAMMLAGAGRLDESVAAFAEAVQAHPGWPDYLRNCVAVGLVPPEAQALTDALV